MPWIKHRFLEDLEVLENNPIKAKKGVLIIGTFNPADIEGQNNCARWFYGRCENIFWALLPQLFGDKSLHICDNHDKSLIQLEAEWKAYCKKRNLVITDIYKAIKGDIKNKSDDSIKDPEEYEAFDFKKAFADAKFEAVILTRSTIPKRTVMGKLLLDAEAYFKSKGIPVYRVLSPSSRVKGSTKDKLNKWRAACPTINRDIL